MPPPLITLAYRPPPAVCPFGFPPWAAPTCGVTLSQPPPSEGASYQDFCVRNSSCVTHGSFDVGGKDKAIGNAWRPAYERGLFQKSGAFGIHDGRTLSSSSASSVSCSSNDGSTGGNTSGGGNSGGSLTTNAYSCETVPSGNAALESRISDSDGASSDSDSRFRITIAAPSSGDGGRAAFSPDAVSSDGDISSSSGVQATMMDTAERSGHGIDFVIFPRCARIVQKKIAFARLSRASDFRCCAVLLCCAGKSILRTRVYIEAMHLSLLIGCTVYHSYACEYPTPA